MCCSWWGTSQKPPRVTDADGIDFGWGGLHFREWRADDAGAMVSLFDTEQVNRWTPLASPFGLRAAQEYVEQAHEGYRRNGTLQLAVLLSPETTPVGEVIVFPTAMPDEVELAYAVGAQHQRQGVATRAVLVALELARARGARGASLIIAEGDDGSAGVARATGFTQTDAPLQGGGGRGSCCSCKHGSGFFLGIALVRQGGAVIAATRRYRLPKPDEGPFSTLGAPLLWTGSTSD